MPAIIWTYSKWSSWAKKSLTGWMNWLDIKTEKKHVSSSRNDWVRESTQNQQNDFIHNCMTVVPLYSRVHVCTCKCIQIEYLCMYFMECVYVCCEFFICCWCQRRQPQHSACGIQNQTSKKAVQFIQHWCSPNEQHEILLYVYFFYNVVHSLGIRVKNSNLTYFIWYHNSISNLVL